jgi:hypothetical protein
MTKDSKLTFTAVLDVEPPNKVNGVQIMLQRGNEEWRIDLLSLKTLKSGCSLVALSVPAK